MHTAQILALVVERRKGCGSVKIDAVEQLRKISGQIVVRCLLSTRRLHEKRLYRFERCPVPASFILLIGNVSGFFRECFDLRGGRRPRHMKASAGLIENAAKSLPLGVALKIIFGSQGEHLTLDR